jgi:ureidoacrylate peracid hydrolase
MNDPRLSPQHAAVVVIDVQNDFCSAQGVQGLRGKDLSAVERTVDNISRLVGAARRQGVPVCFAYTTHSSDLDTDEWLDRRPNGCSGASNCVEGTWGAELYRLEPAPEDLVIEKHRYSAFAGTDLEARLKGLGRRSLLFCGYTSNACVETSLRDAVCRDFLATLVADCCDAYDPEAHERAIRSVQDDFGLVSTTDAILRQWASAVGGAA